MFINITLLLFNKKILASLWLVFSLSVVVADDHSSFENLEMDVVLMPDEDDIVLFEDSAEDEFKDDSWSDLTLSLDFRNGYWRHRQSYLPAQPLSEIRAQIEFDKDTDWFIYSVVADFIYDDVLASNVGVVDDVNLESGEGWLDLRHLNVSFTPINFMDVKIGRQIVTWGTGDLVFINDLFPKDWNAFFIGRKEDYLKAPSDVIKMAMFHDVANIDFVYTPLFDADRFVDGRRVSFFNAQLNQITGTNTAFVIEQPDKLFASQEFALRAYRNLANYEVAAYGYQGYWKSPLGVNSTNNALIFPPLRVLGASLRGPLWSGIANIEFGQYISGDDATGNDPLIPNSEFRGLWGYEQEVVTDLTAGIQYYFRKKSQYNRYLNTLPLGMFTEYEYRHEFSLRMTGMAWSQKIRWTVFSLYAPRDQDGFIRGSLKYQQDDHWSYTLGWRLFFGEKIDTDNGQFQNNDNLYFALRYGY